MDSQEVRKGVHRKGEVPYQEGLPQQMLRFLCSDVPGPIASQKMPQQVYPERQVRLDFLPQEVLWHLLPRDTPTSGDFFRPNVYAGRSTCDASAPSEANRDS